MERKHAVTQERTATEHTGAEARCGITLAAERAADHPDGEVTAAFADGGETFTLEGRGPTEWITADAETVVEVRR